MPYYFPRLHREFYSGLAEENLTFIADLLVWPPAPAPDAALAEAVRAEAEAFVVRLPQSPKEAMRRLQATLSAAEDYSASRIFGQLSQIANADERTKRKAEGETVALRTFLAVAAQEDGLVGCDAPEFAAPAAKPLTPEQAGQLQLLLLIAMQHERAVLDEQAGRKALQEARANFSKALSGLGDDDEEEELEHNLEAVADGAFAALVDGMKNAPLLAPEISPAAVARALAPFVPDNATLYTDDTAVVDALLAHMEGGDHAVAREVSPSPFAALFPALAAPLNGTLRAIEVAWAMLAENRDKEQANRKVTVLFHE